VTFASALEANNRSVTAVTPINALSKFRLRFKSVSSAAERKTEGYCYWTTFLGACKASWALGRGGASLAGRISLEAVLLRLPTVLVPLE
jgi:hypothetical protein